MTLDDCYLACRDVVRKANSSFPLAFRLLSRPKRRAMDALYAFARISDDLADEPGEPHEKRDRLDAWEQSLRTAITGADAPPILRALHDTVQRYAIPEQYLFDVIDGVRMDLDPIHIANFAELRVYCHRVAGAVGLACIRIWGVRAGVSWEEADGPAEAAGLAFQLTNILRDLDEDCGRGRCYLPADELDKGRTFHIERAREFYREAERLDALITNEGRAIFHAMKGLYRALLERIALSPEHGIRVRVPRWRKAAIFLSAWPVKWGLR